MLKNFLVPGRASFICGGMWGSEAKGAAAAWVAAELMKSYFPRNDVGVMNPGRWFDIVTTNAGAQAGHTSIHNGNKAVVYHLPTAPLIASGSVGYLNAGAIIDPGVLRAELERYGRCFSQFYIHPNAAIITQGCRDAEGRADSVQTKIASTRKGVGQALARKVLRSGVIAGYPQGASGNDWMLSFIRPIDLNAELSHGKSVLVEVPQGFGLGLNERFYPHCTSRQCTPAQAASDANIHHSLCGPVMLVLRTFPIRVGNINDVIVGEAGQTPFHNVTLGSSGGCYPDQRELTWDELEVKPEITTVTKRVRRVFTWSQQQVIDAFAVTRPTHVFLSHVDYFKPDGKLGSLQGAAMSILTAAHAVSLSRPQLFYSIGPTTADVREWLWED